MRNMSSPLSLETLLVLACVRRDLDAERIQDLVKRGPDWHAILRGVERWRLAPLVYTSLRQADATGRMPNPVAERLRHLYRRQTIHWIDQREVLRETLQLFSEAGVPTIVLKGAALATLVYPSPALRPTSKVDLLVRHRDAARVQALLKSMRHAPASPTAAGAGAGPDSHPGLGHWSRRRMDLVDVCTHFLNLRPVDRLPAAQIPIEKLWERARPANRVSGHTRVQPGGPSLARRPRSCVCRPVRGPCQDAMRYRPNVRAIRGCDRLESSYCGGTCLPDGEAALLCPALGT